MSLTRNCLYCLQALREHSTNARLTRDQLAALQRRKFRRLAAYVYEKSPYYRDLMRRLKLDPKTCLPEDFPVLTKHDVNEHFDEIVTDRRITRRSVIEFVGRDPGSASRFLSRYHVVHSTGTSGTMVYLVFSEKDWIQGSSLILRVPSPLRLRKRVASVLAAEPNLVARELTADGERFPANPFYHCRILDVAWSLDRILEQLNQFQPHYLTSYVGVMLLLADVQRKGVLHIRPQEVSTGGELLTAHDRERIEQAFGVRLRHTYACSEALYLALSMAAGDGLYLQEDETVFELYGDHTCITPLFNFTTPLIRYRMNDVLVPEEHTSGTLPFLRVRELIGREEQDLVFSQPARRNIRPALVGSGEASRRRRRSMPVRPTR